MTRRWCLDYFSRWRHLQQPWIQECRWMRSKFVFCGLLNIVTNWEYYCCLTFALSSYTIHHHFHFWSFRSETKPQLGAPLNIGNSCSFKSFRTNNYKLHFMESPSGLKVTTIQICFCSCTEAMIMLKCVASCRLSSTQIRLLEICKIAWPTFTAIYMWSMSWKTLSTNQANVSGEQIVFARDHRKLPLHLSLLCWQMVWMQLWAVLK